MKPIIWVGIVLIVLGGLILAYQGIDYTREKNVLDVGCGNSPANSSSSSIWRVGNRWRCRVAGPGGE
jgi:hypothetical protein